jgi:glycosyltransferase involved in cell wall biosynthesis
MLEDAKDYRIEWPESLKFGMRFRVGWAISAWNRPLELKRSLDSIAQSDMRNTVLVLVDDASSNPYTKNILREFRIHDIPIIKIHRIAKVHARPNNQVSLRIAWDVLHSYCDCEYMGVLDSDTLVRKHWTQRLCDIADIARKEYDYFILSGFNTHRHRNLSTHKHYVTKASLGGINMLFPRNHYMEVVRASLNYHLWDWRLCIICAYKNAALLALRPSVIQHIGYFGIWSKGRIHCDMALDYYFPPLSSYRIIYFCISLIDALLIRTQNFLTKERAH